MLSVVILNVFYAECRILFIIMLNVMNIMQCVIMLCVVMLCVVMLNAIMPSVVAPIFIYTRLRRYDGDKKSSLAKKECMTKKKSFSILKSNLE